MGRIVSEISDEAIRELIYRDCRIIYIVGADDEQVEVPTVVHSSQHLRSLNSDDL